MFKKTIYAAAATYFFMDRKIKCSPQPPLSSILRGAYQNKIRRFSPPQKIFDVFATIYDEGQLYMSLPDLLKAICFYNYSVSDQTHIQGFNPPHIISFLGKSDKYQIYDYFILARFLAFDKQLIQNYFVKNHIKKMNKKQFCQFLDTEVCSDYLDHIKQGILVEARQFTPSKEDFDKKVQEIAKSIFKDQQYLVCHDINQYRKQMMAQLYQFQFRMFPIQDNQIDGVDLARSIIKYVEPSKTKKYMVRIKNLKQLQKVKIDLKAYQAFHMYLWANMSQIQTIINKKGALSTSQLTQLIQKYVNKKGTVKTQQVQAVVKVLDYDDSGFLQKKQILGVLKQLQYYTTVKSGQLTLFQSLKKDFQNFIDKINKIKDILQQ